MQQLANQELLSTMHYEWTEMAYLELQAGNTAMIIFRSGGGDGVLGAGGAV